jgi:hypothetical protein
MRSTSGPCFLATGIKVIDRLKTARLDALAGLFDGFFDLSARRRRRFRHRARYFHFFRDLFVGPVDSGDVGEKSKASSASSRRNVATATALARREAQRVLRGGPGLGTNSTPAPGTAASIAALISSPSSFQSALSSSANQSPASTVPVPVPCRIGTGHTPCSRWLQIVRALLGHGKLALRSASR